MADDEGDVSSSTTTDKSSAEEPADKRDASISVKAAPSDATRTDSIGTDHAAEDDDSRDISSITAAASAVYDATRWSTRLARRLARYLDNVSAVFDSASDAYVSVIVLSDHIKSKHPSAAVHAQRNSEHLAVFHV